MDGQKPRHGKRRVPAPSPVPTPADLAPASPAPFPIIGMGASAGGLAAFEAFFQSMPPATGRDMAFVIVQHLDPVHKSILVELIQKYASLEVSVAHDGGEVLPGHVYVIPPNRDLALLGGRLHLLEPASPRGMRLPIDFFFRSLAQDRHDNAICIVLSGTGSDGTLGLKAVKGEGGMVMVQSPGSAGYDGMPRSALATGMADFELPPDRMPEALLAYVHRTFAMRRPLAPVPSAPVADGVPKVLALLRAQTGHDFSQYKPNTIRRRIERRIALAQVDHLDDYLRYLRDAPREADLLFREMLIGVTAFFRDPEAFEALRDNVLEPLLEGAGDGTVRIWLPGCSTGEEAYSIAILVREIQDARKSGVPVQIFATDLDDRAIDTARTAVYPENIAADVSPERLARFFAHESGNFRVVKSIRDQVVFARHDLLKDPPFSRLDLVSCRNLLIYLGGEAQRKVLSLFHCALNPKGFLMLGPSESIGDLHAWFAPADRKWKIYQRRGAATARAVFDTRIPPPPADRVQGSATQTTTRMTMQAFNGRTVAETALLEAYVPAGLLVDANLDVLYFHGHLGRYLEPASGDASLNLLKLAREGLRLELAGMARKALAQRTPVRLDGVRFPSEGGIQAVNLHVMPVTGTDAQKDLLVIAFENVAAPGAVAEGTGDAGTAPPDGRLQDLERELRAKSIHLQSANEELESLNEEMKSTNEELQSSNEELQSTNEELETSREELQSVNEELVTVNTELQKTIEELSLSNSDMTNLLAGTNIGTLFVDHQLRIQRFTPAMTQIIHLILTDVGRPVSDIVSRMKGYDRLVADTRAVLDTLIPRDAEVQTLEGQHFQMRIQPYRTQDNVIEGAVLTFVDITGMKDVAEELRRQGELTRAILEVSGQGILVCDDQGACIFFNGRMQEITGWSKEDAGRPGFTRHLFPGTGDGGAQDPAPAAQDDQAPRPERRDLVRQDGTRRIVEVTSRRLPFENRQWMVLRVLDITGTEVKG